MKNDVTIPVISINRHRMEVDGAGVTTLVGAYGCPLQCKYCLNPHAWNPQTKCRDLTPLQLYDEVKIDDLYFLATDGGITFGGGESLLHAAFIKKFTQVCRQHGSPWKITVETSLQILLSHLEMGKDCIDLYIIDIKDMNPEIYFSYTQKNNTLVLQNLKWLLSQVNPEKIKIRVPLIPDFNTKEDMTASILTLEKMGFCNISPFSYVIK